MRYPEYNIKTRAGNKAQTKSKSSSPASEAWFRLRRNKTAVIGMIMIILLILAAIFAPLIARYDPSAQDYSALKAPPGAEHWFGTDSTGRDLFARCIYACRVSLPLALICTAASLLLGGSLGFLSGYFGGKTDQIIMRIMDIFQAIPAILMAIAIISCLGNSIVNLVIAMAVSTMPLMARMCRGALFTVKGADYLESSKAIGAGNMRILLKHMIPNAVGTVIIFVVGAIAGSIMIISTLSYIGLGITPPTPEWGSILNAGRQYISSSPHLVIFPGLMIMYTCFAFNMFGDGLRDALDPRLK